MAILVMEPLKFESKEVRCLAKEFNFGDAVSHVAFKFFFHGWVFRVVDDVIYIQSDIYGWFASTIDPKKRQRALGYAFKPISNKICRHLLYQCCGDLSIHKGF